jgi:hypothetical protein
MSALLHEAIKASVPDFWEATEKRVKEETERLSKLDRHILQRVIEGLITKLHPDGEEAVEILAALISSQESRYDNQMVTIARLQEHYSGLKKTLERAYDAA